ncbi:Ribonuclease III [hydrothermal vent metagenome]|uniref:ribonuclease III n=1 Tax=hydrothermal vent metagenome TaxID=652676 RepID=A0A3B0Z1P4_9ZZZZ
MIVNLDRLQSRSQLGYQFQQIKHLEQALTHRSLGRTNNERLEYLGDAILGFVIASEVYSRFPQASEGELSRMRSQLVKGQTLAEVARSLGLGDYLRLGTGELKSGGHRRDSILAGALEAILGAVYIDSEIESTTNLIVNLFRPRLDTLTPETAQKDPKTTLQEYLQARKLSLPAYTMVTVEGAEHEQKFKVNCSIDELEIAADGVGINRRNAEQHAADEVLKKISNLNNN